MFNYIWPIALIVISNIIYHICSKNIPSNINPFASLTISYLTGAVLSTIIYLITNKQEPLLKEFGKLNWAPFVLGFVIVGIEVGFLYAYRNGWQISTTSIVQSTFVAMILFFIGCFFFKEPLTWNKIVGTIICLVGLIFINIK